MQIETSTLHINERDQYSQYELFCAVHITQGGETSVERGIAVARNFINCDGTKYSLNCS